MARDWLKPNANAIIFIVILVTLCLGGGSSRADTLSLLFLRPTLIILLCLMVHHGAVSNTRSLAVYWMLLALAVIVMLGLLPIPLEWWRRLPGRERYLADFMLAREPTWMFLSLSPDRTLNSLLALLAPLAGLLLAATMMRARQHGIVVAGLIVTTTSSALVGSLQLVDVTQLLALLP